MSTEDWRSKLSALMDKMPAEETTQAEADARETSSARPIEKARLDIVLDRKGRNGKTATIISGFTIDDEAITSLASELKQRLGTGGSARGCEILIQGDRRKDVLDYLIKKGIKARII